MSRAERAKEYFLQGYACSQAVLLAFSDVTGLDAETAEKISLPFGGGMGRLRLTCGAVSGAVMVLGLLTSATGVNPENKKLVYGEVQDYTKRFTEENGSIVCGELLKGANVQTTTETTADKRTNEYYKKRPCAELVYNAAQILEDKLREL